MAVGGRAAAVAGLLLIAGVGVVAPEAPAAVHGSYRPLVANYGLDKPFRQATWAELAGHRYRGQLTILRSQDVLQLLADHPTST